jgi:PelA/Pel-15E family pectate lyase
MRLLALCLISVCAGICCAAEGPAPKPEWYAGAEAIRIADNFLLYQRANGGWPKGKDLEAPLSDQEKTALAGKKQRTDTSLDNDSTHSQIRFLAKVQAATGHERFRAAILKGIDWLLAAQYPSGGWPQFYPDTVSYNQSVSRRNPEGLARFITFNDDAMIGAMRVLDGVARRQPEFRFVDDARRLRAAKAVQASIACILRCQVRVNGVRAAWAAQYDDRSFEPRWGRTFEPVAISVRESVSIVRFLLDIENPGREVREAVVAAVAWFQKVRLSGIRVLKKPDSSSPRGFDRVVVQERDAPAVWTRYYEIGTNRPLFGDRDDEVHFSLAEISLERRTGYEWYGAWAEELIRTQYPAWRKARAGR